MRFTPSEKPNRQSKIKISDFDPETEEERVRPPTSVTRLMRTIFAIPWWFVALVAIMIIVAQLIRSDETYQIIFDQIMKGFWLTIKISFIAYGIALVFGLLLGVIRSTVPKPQAGLRRGINSFIHMVIYQFATFFVEIMRGLPMIIVLLIAAFVISPNFKDFMLETFNLELNFKGSSTEVAIMALSMVYAAYLAEVFRAGIQSIDKGQIEAARSLGMNMFQVTIYIVLPQATRRVVPPLGNDFIAMIKDSSLALVLGLREMSQMAKLWAGSTFRYEQTYLVLAVIYLFMTIMGSLAVRYIERYMKSEER